MYYVVHSTEYGTDLKNFWSMDREGNIKKLEKFTLEDTYICYGNWSYFVYIRNKIDITLPRKTLEQALSYAHFPHSSIKDKLLGLWLLYGAIYKKGDVNDEDE